MQTAIIGHLLFMVDPANFSFYRDLLAFLGWQAIWQDEQVLGMGSGTASIWFSAATSSHTNDHDAHGLNHLALSPSSQADVDATVAYLGEHGVAPLFETPRHRPEWAGEGSTYYQVMFESPDRILFEVVYTGPLATDS